MWPAYPASVLRRSYSAAPAVVLRAARPAEYDRPLEQIISQAGRERATGGRALEPSELGLRRAVGHAQLGRALRLQQRSTERVTCSKLSS